MSYVLTAIISMIFGAGVMACFKVIGGCSESERQKEALKEAHRIGYCEGHRNGLRKGKVLKIDAALYEELKARVTGRVDVAPGNDEHTEFILCCPMPFKSAKIVRSDEEPRIISCDRVDVAPGPDSIRPE